MLCWLIKKFRCEISKRIQKWTTQIRAQLAFVVDMFLFEDNRKISFVQKQHETRFYCVLFVSIDHFLICRLHVVCSVQTWLFPIYQEPCVSYLITEERL